MPYRVNRIALLMNYVTSLPTTCQITAKKWKNRTLPGMDKKFQIYSQFQTQDTTKISIKSRFITYSVQPSI